MRFIFKLLSISISLLGSVSLLQAQTANRNTIITELLAQPPSAAVQLATRHADTLKVEFLPADLDGSGKFQFIIAAYSLVQDNQGVFLRVFQQQSTGLLLVGEQEDSARHGGFGTSVKLVAIKGGGVPQVEVKFHYSDGSQILHEYLTWTGRSLHSSIDGVADSN